MTRSADFGIRGILRVRTHDAGGTDLAAVARDIGPQSTTENGTPDVIVDFVDDLSPASLSFLDGGTTGHGDDGVYFLDSFSGRPLARVSQGERWGEALIVCVRGVPRVPFLSSAVDLAALSRGWAPLHGSAWVTKDGTGVLVLGWAHSGKTGALLAAFERGATLVGDDRILLSRDGSRVVGLGRSIVVKDWHLAQLRIPALDARPVRRALAKAAPILDALSGRVASRRRDRRGGWTRLGGKVLGRLRGKLSVELDPRLMGRSKTADEARPDVLVILETHRHPSVESESVDPGTAASRIAAQVEAELMPALRAQLSFEYALPGRGWRDVGRAPEVAKSIVNEATRRLPTYVVRHPHPCSLRELDDAIAGVVASTRPRGDVQ